MYKFFLGTSLGKMEEVREFLLSKGIGFFVNNFEGGARVSLHESNIHYASREYIPVLVELVLDNVRRLPPSSLIINCRGRKTKSSLYRVKRLLQTVGEQAHRMVDEASEKTVAQNLEMSA